MNELTKLEALEPDAMQNATEQRRRRALFFSKFVNFIPLIGLAVVVGLYFLSIAITGYRLSLQMQTIINDIILVTFVATGASFIFAIGSFDLSLGSNMLVCAIVSSLVYNATGSLLLMVVVCVVLATVISLVNYLLASVFSLPVFIMTVAMMTVLSTIANLLVGRDTVYLAFATRGNADYDIYTKVLSTVWFRFLLLGVYVLICCFLFYFTKLGREQKFLGGNPICAKLSGVAPVKMAFISFTMAGIGIGLAAFCASMPTGSVTYSTGSSVGMNMLIAIVFGGMALSGGAKSKAFAAFIGGCTMAFLDRFMSNILAYAEVETGKDAITMIVKAVLFLVVAFLLAMATRPKMLPR
jgi:ribose transport system permease protein